MIEKCPICGSDINYGFGYSYYLRCKKSYGCWHQSCDESTAKLYPEYITPSQELQAYSMREKLENDDCDYFHDDFNF